MFKPILKGLFVSVVVTAPLIIAESAKAWDCSSRCKAWQPDCYAWKAANCGKPLNACSAFHVSPYFTQVVVVMRNTKPALRQIGVTNKSTCQAQAPAVAAVVSKKGTPLAGAMSIPFTRCACDQAF